MASPAVPKGQLLALWPLPGHSLATTPTRPSPLQGGSQPSLQPLGDTAGVLMFASSVACSGEARRWVTGVEPPGAPGLWPELFSVGPLWSALVGHLRSAPTLRAQWGLESPVARGDQRGQETETSFYQDS